MRATAQATLQIVASGLVNPRGLNFGPEGALYVAEAGSGGSGPCIVNSNSQLVCYGATGAITRITPFTQNLQRLVRNSAAWFAFSQMANGRSVADLSAFEVLAKPDGGAFDSNPYGVLAQPGRVVFTDAGGNSLNALAANGSISNLAAFFDRLVPFGGGEIPMQAVPTTVARGPDGALYVGQLTGFPFPAGAANVYRVPADGGAPANFSSGFTKIIDIAFGADGSLYVLQISAAGGPPPAVGPGSVIRVSSDGATKTTIVPAGGDWSLRAESPSTMTDRST
jgi:hypothetical protein